MVKKSETPTKRSTVFSPMWSASRKYGAVQPRAFTAASAAARVLVGSEPMMLCSRLDLFQTGTISTPSFLAARQAASWASASWAKRSPMPRENLPMTRGWEDIRGVRAARVGPGRTRWQPPGSLIFGVPPPRFSLPSTPRFIFTARPPYAPEDCCPAWRLHRP